MKTLGILLIACFLPFSEPAYAQGASGPAAPLRVGVVGLTHAHVHWILGREKRGDIEIVGIAEPNRELAERFAEQHGFDMSLVYPSLEEMVEKTKPEAVTAFNSIFDHLKTVEYCAPRGIHVMVEKPLAVSYDHAEKMIRLARENGIYLLTNYETTWYGSNAKAYRLVHEDQAIGEIRKMVFHHGHQGPIEIGCNPEFLEFLTDPVLNGGGALTDFGCYGANLATWFLQGQEPESVTCLTRQIKPDLYPKVEDEATILLNYPKAQVVIQASWNWPFGRKDAEIYGTTGYVFCRDGRQMSIMENEKTGPWPLRADPLPKSVDDPFAYLEQVVRGKVKVRPFDLSSPENNEIVVKILEAARHAAKTGKTVEWKRFFK